MATETQYQPIIKESLQRFDIADFDALTAWTKKYVNEHVKDIIANAVGRVFHGFKVEAGSGALDIKIMGEALAVNAAGEIMLRKAADADITLTLPGAAGNYYISMIPQEQETTTANRKKWDTGTSAEVTASVATFKAYKADFINPPPTAATLDIGNFAASYVDSGGVTRTPLPVAIVVHNGVAITAFHDCRRMFAVNGNVNGSVTGLGTEFPHDFAPTDTKTLGITSTREHLVALADRVKALGGGTNWYDAPATSLANVQTYLGDVNARALHSGFAASLAGTTLTVAAGELLWDGVHYTYAGGTIAIPNDGEAHYVYAEVSAGAVVLAQIAFSAGGWADKVHGGTFLGLANSSAATWTDCRHLVGAVPQKIVVTVGDAGNFATLQAAVDALEQQLSAPSGTRYAEAEIVVCNDLTVTSPVLLWATSASKLTVRGAHRGVTISWSFDGTTGPLFSVRAADTTIRDLTLTRTGGTALEATNIAAGAGVRLSNITTTGGVAVLVDFTGGALATYAPTVVEQCVQESTATHLVRAVDSGAHYLTVRECAGKNVTLTNMYSGYVQIVNNRLSDSGVAPINLSFPLATDATALARCDVLVQGNDLTHDTGTNSIISLTSAVALHSGASGDPCRPMVRVVGNNIRGTARGATANVVSVVGSGGQTDGFAVFTGNRIEIAQVTAYGVGSSNYAVSLDASSIVFSNNSIFVFGGATPSFNGLSVSGPGCVVTNNEIYGRFVTAAIVVSGAFSTVSGNTIRAETAYAVYVSNKGVVIASNTLIMGSAVAVGIFLTGGSGYCNINGNVIDVKGQSPSLTYPAIRVTTSGNTVSNNTITSTLAVAWGGGGYSAYAIDHGGASNTAVGNRTEYGTALNTASWAVQSSNA